MSKFKLLLLIGVMVTIVACGGQAPATPTAQPTATKTAPPTAVAAPTKPSGGLAITPAVAANPPKLDPGGMCKVANTPKPVPDFPATTPADQSRGSDKATVVMYEYSDFQ